MQANPICFCFFIEHWKAYADKAASQYRPQLLARTRHLDWMKILEDAEKDIDIARNAQAK